MAGRGAVVLANVHGDGVGERPPVYVRVLASLYAGERDGLVVRRCTRTRLLRTLRQSLRPMRSRQD